VHEDDLTPEERLENLVYRVIDPESHFRRAAAHGLVRELQSRFGPAALIDMLIAIDNTNMLASMIVLDRNEVDDYLYTKYGTFDDDMMVKVQLTDAWEDFTSEIIQRSGLAAAKAINEVMEASGVEPLK